MSPKKFTQEKIEPLEFTKYRNFTKLKVLPVDTYLPGYVSTEKTLTTSSSSCKVLWTFAFVLVFIFCFMSCVRNWDFNISLPIPVFAGFIVGRKERIEKKLETFYWYVEEFDRKLTNVRAKDIWLCPKCFSDNVIKKDAPKPWEGFLGKLRCKDCGHVFRKEVLPGELGIEAYARIVNQVIRLSVRGLKNVEDIHNEVLDTAYDYGFNFDLGRTTIYDIRRKVAKLLEWLDRFIIVGLLEGIPCEQLEVDEIFQSRLHRRELRKYLEGEKEPEPRFYYLINAISQKNRYPLPSEVAEARNKNAFLSFVLKMGMYLRADPKIINSDELRPLVGALKLKFPFSEIDTTKREKQGKIGMGKVAHVERLNRTYRKAIPKRKKLGGKGVIYNLASLVRILNTCLWRHEKLNKRIVEALGIPFPKNIKTPSDLILFASYIKQNSRAILGDEYEIFENTVFGRCVFTIQFDQETFNLIGQYIRKDRELIIALNAWIPVEERNRIVEDFLRSCDGSIVIELPMGFNVYIVKTVHEADRYIVHIVGDIPTGLYTMVLPVRGERRRHSVLYLDPVWIDPGKVNHFYFRFVVEDYLDHVTRESG